jgi:hypothetical protein
LVPVRTSNQAFEPALVIIGSDLKGTGGGNVNFPIPPGYLAETLSAEKPWPEFFEPFSFERLYTAAATSVEVHSGRKYYMVVYSPGHTQGDYVIGIGQVEDFTDISFTGTIKSVGLMKLGLVDATEIPWMEIIGLLLFLVGVIVSLRMVGKIHTKIKCQIWWGYFMALLGAIMLYHKTGTNGVATFQAIIAIILLANNFGLSHQLGMSASCGKQPQLSAGIIIFVVGWATILILLAWYLLVSR